VIGYGAIGQACRAMGVALGMRVLVSDPHVRVRRAGSSRCDLATLLAASDYVVCLAIANEQTENLMNDAAFVRMKRAPAS
jgi:D-3-phosphoglycerate dehydrogenase